jgi:hypothetical protein
VKCDDGDPFHAQARNPTGRDDPVRSFRLRDAEHQSFNNQIIAGDTAGGGET